MSTPTPPWGSDPDGQQPGTEPTQPYPGYTPPPGPGYPPPTPTPGPAPTPGYDPYGQGQQSPYGQPQYGQPAPPPYGYHAYGYGAPPPTNGLAIASLVVSILSAVGICLCLFPGLFGAVGAILGHVARRQIATRGEQGGPLALSGIIVGWIAFALSLVVVAFYVVVIVASGSDSWDYSTF